MGEPIFNYCERTAIGLFNEPMNAVSNISFFIAAWLLYQSWRANPDRSFEAGLLTFLVALIGLGSTLFHTFANQLTMFADIIPISIFTFYYLWVAMRVAVGLRPMKAFWCLILFTVIASQSKYIPDPWRFNGSVDYFPSLAALLLIGSWLVKQRHPSGSYILKAGLLFVVSLTFRSIDYAVCPALATGTHFLWHLLNGLMLYLLVKAIIVIARDHKACKL